MKLSDFRMWLESQIPDYVEARVFVGDYIENPADKDKVLIALRQSTATRPPFVRYNRYRITILSTSYRFGDDDYSGDLDLGLGDYTLLEDESGESCDKPETWAIVEEIAEAIEKATNNDDMPCSGNIQLVAGKQGPLYTSDGRIYFTLEVQSII